MEKLEDRILFDAVPDGSFIETSDVDDQPQIVQHQAITEEMADTTGRELIVIDSRVEDAGELLKSVLASDSNSLYEIRYLNQEQDGVAQLADILVEQTDDPYSAIHLISHGSSSELQIGADTIDFNDLSLEQKQNLRTIGQALTDDAEMLVAVHELGASVF